MKVTKRDAAIATVAYADIFKYAITADELTRWLIFYKHASGRLILPKNFQYVGPFFCLPKRKSLIRLRKKRQEWSSAKWSIVHKVLPWYRFIPTVGLVGVTGALAMDNATRGDDIDLFFIVDSHVLWVSRFFITLITEFLGRRRHREEKYSKDKICLNMFMSSESLALPSGERDIFAAHEVLQMVPVLSKGNTYQQFLKANSWVKQYLPNAWESKQKATRDKGQGKLDGVIIFSEPSYFALIASRLLRFFELPAKSVQLWYMKRHRTTEVITDDILRFHPRDARDWIKRKLKIRLARFNIPLDNIFFYR